MAAGGGEGPAAPCGCFGAGGDAHGGGVVGGARRGGGLCGVVLRRLEAGTVRWRATATVASTSEAAAEATTTEAVAVTSTGHLRRRGLRWAVVAHCGGGGGGRRGSSGARRGRGGLLTGHASAGAEGALRRRWTVIPAAVAAAFEVIGQSAPVEREAVVGLSGRGATARGRRSGRYSGW